MPGTVIAKPDNTALWREVYRSILNDWKKDLVSIPSLPRPFMSESAGWNFMFYWDNYFMNLGLLRLPGYEKIARDATDNLIALVDKYGFVPNCTLSWGTNRSQPPYLSQMVREVYEKIPDKAWLRTAYSTLRKEYSFWMDEGANPLEDHRTSIEGLSRNSHHASRQELLEFYRGPLHDRFAFSLDKPAEEMLAVAGHFMSEAAGGMDFTSRFEHRCADFAAVDLNVLLYMYERNFAWMEKEIGEKGDKDWKAAAAKRSLAIQKRLWNEARGFYLDYDTVHSRPSIVACCTGFTPMWAGIADRRQADAMVRNLSLFERDYGLATCEPCNEERVYQWNYPVGWPPHMALVMLALESSGYQEPALRIARKYLNVVSSNFERPVSSNAILNPQEQKRTPGNLYEKYDVTTGRIADREYPAFTGRGWTAGVFVYAYQLSLRSGLGE